MTVPRGIAALKLIYRSVISKSPEIQVIQLPKSNSGCASSDMQLGNIMTVA